jgi:enoyl-CoA hydratase/carnithine racemase
MMENTVSDSLVKYEVDESVSIITMNRPEKLNAISRDFKAALSAAFRKGDEDPATSVALLRANGRSFCVGYDIGGSEEDDAIRYDAIKWHDFLRECVAFELAPWDMKKPVVALVQGHALGGGCELAMMCDITIAAEDALFGEPEIRFSNAGPAIVMPWFIGLKKARELLYLGDMIDAKAALDLGMINKIVPAAELLTAGLKFAKRLSLISPEALYLTKLSINRGAEAAGFRNAVNVGVDVVSMLYAAKTEMGMKFNEITKNDGLKAALKWRGDQFKE